MIFGIYDLNDARRKKICFHLLSAAKEIDVQIKIVEFDSESRLLNYDLTVLSCLWVSIDTNSQGNFQIARLVKEKKPNIYLILLSNSLQNALDGYEINAFRYILFSDFPHKIKRCINDISNNWGRNEEVVNLKVIDGKQWYWSNDIVYLESFRHLVVIHLANGQHVHSRERLSTFENELSKKGFLRIQKSFLVNMAHLVRINHYYAEMDTGTKLKCSESRYREILSAFKDWGKEQYSVL